MVTWGHFLAPVTGKVRLSSGGAEGAWKQGGDEEGPAVLARAGAVSSVHPWLCLGHLIHYSARHSAVD